MGEGVLGEQEGGLYLTDKYMKVNFHIPLQSNKAIAKLTELQYHSSN